MIYFLHGTDIKTARKKMRGILDTLQLKRPGSEIFKMNTETWRDDLFEELLYSQGLFDQKYIVILDNLFEKKEIKEVILDKLPQMKESINMFLWLEEKVDAKALKVIEKNSEKVQEFSAPQVEYSKKEISPFVITDGLLQKDKKKLWVSYTNFIKKGISAEELHGILFWQVKNMTLTSRAKDQRDSGLSPYQYKNALSGGRKYKEDELVSMMSELVSMTHKVRTGEGEMDMLLEKWILNL